MADETCEEDGSSRLSHLSVEDMALDRKGGGGGRGRGAGRGGGRGQSRDTQVSKALSRLLRHQAENAGIKLDSEGYAPLDRVLAWGPVRSLNVTFSDIQTAVADNEKQRFSLKRKSDGGGSSSSTDPADYLIRANQGHSIKLESSSHLEALTPEAGNIPPLVVHGTYFAFWPAIVSAGGLRPMGRNHVHCSTGTPEDGVSVVSGMRRDAELLIEIDVERSIAEGGMKWWRSDNGVILSEGVVEGAGEAWDPQDTKGLVSSRFFKRVTGRLQDVGVLWEDGEWRADLPAGIKKVVPPGKGPRGGRGGRRGGGRGRGGGGST